MPHVLPPLVRIAIIVVILAADGRGVPQVVRADGGVQSQHAATLSVMSVGCADESCCGAGSDCCCSGPRAGDEPSAEPAVSCCGGGMDHAALPDDASATGCQCSWSPVDDGPRVPMVPAQPAESQVVDAVAIELVAGTDGVLMETALAGYPTPTPTPQPDSLLRHLAALCCWRA